MVTINKTVIKSYISLLNLGMKGMQLKYSYIILTGLGNKLMSEHDS